jgi:hypothetical protein
MPAPTFRMDDDGVHFWWTHRCRIVSAGKYHGHEYTSVSMMPDTTWQVTQVEPLTVSPSIDCRACGTHGFITNGAWVGV